MAIESQTPVESREEVAAAVALGESNGIPSPAKAGGLPRPKGAWFRPDAVRYDPEKGFRESDFLTPATEAARRFLVAPEKISVDMPVQEAEKWMVKLPNQPAAFLPKDVEGQVLTYVEEGKRWKPHRINSAMELKTFNESALGKSTRFRERFGFDTFGLDADRSSTTNTQLIDQNDFIPILGGPFYKQLYIYDYLKMHATAFQQTNHSALAAAAIKIMMRFTLGRGISFHVRHPKAKAIWDEFTMRNKYRNKLREMARDLPWQGELMIRYYEKERGFTSIRVLDPSTCWEVLTDPEDIEHVYYYHFQWPTPYQIWVQGKIPVSKYIIAQIPPTNIQHIKINVSSQEKRGRSDLLAAMPWIKRFNDFYDGQTVKAVLEANLVYKIKVKGDQADVDAFLQNPALTELPPPGGTWIENEAVELTSMSAAMTSSRGSSGIGQQLASIVFASMNLPAEYANIETAGPARATALVRTDPAVKTIEDRQQLIRETNEDIYEHVMAVAYEAGRLPREAAIEEPETGDEEPLPEGVDAQAELMGKDEQDNRVVQARMLRTAGVR